MIKRNSNFLVKTLLYMTDRADQPGKVTCVSCADKSICRAHFTSSTFFNLLQQTSVSNKHGKKHCSVVIVVIHRQRHQRVSFLKELYPSNSPFFLSSLDQMLLRLQTFSTFSFSVLLLRGWNILLARGLVNPLCIVLILFFFVQPK